MIERLTPVPDGTCLTPSERMWRIRATREHIPDWDGRSFWMTHGVLAIPGLRELPERVRADRAWARRHIAYDDWQARVKRKRQISVKTRRVVIARAGGKCCYCGLPVPDRYFVMDHIVPVTRGGRSRPGNLAASCSRCNHDKSALTPAEWRVRWYR